MKRLSVHAAFALAATALAALAAVQGLRLHAAQRLNAGIAAAAPTPPSRDAPRALRLAHATALSKAGAFDAAFKAYSSVLEPGRSDALSLHAQYNLGNMYLRQALQADAGADNGPLLELAKQRLRDLLRADPQDWDARYNLERALRAAPEEQESAADAQNQPVERRNVMLRGMTPGDLP